MVWGFDTFKRLSSKDKNDFWNKDADAKTKWCLEAAKEKGIEYVFKKTGKVIENPNIIGPLVKEEGNNKDTAHVKHHDLAEKSLMDVCNNAFYKKGFVPTFKVKDGVGVAMVSSSKDEIYNLKKMYVNNEAIEGAKYLIVGVKKEAAVKLASTHDPIFIVDALKDIKKFNDITCKVMTDEDKKAGIVLQLHPNEPKNMVALLDTDLTCDSLVPGMFRFVGHDEL